MNESSRINRQCNKKILILDDEADIRRTMIEMFEALGYKCDGANDGFQGIELLAKNDYWLVISDIMMPEISGPEFFRRVQNKYKYDYFVFLTGYEIPEQEKGTVSQADLLLFKPITIDKLLNSIGRLSSKKTA